jgi:hypothetical protein
MGRPIPTPITCPNCRQPFSALLEQVIDVSRDPESKQRLLSGRVNQIVCPNCGFNGTASTPILYHDHSKELLIAFVPMELGVGQMEQERLIGSLTNSVMNSLPAEERKGYLLQPKMSLTMQGLIDQVLEADGITKEVIEEQQRKANLVTQLAQASPEEQDRLLAENADLIDEVFFELLNVLAAATTQQGRSRDSLRLLNLRTRLLDITEVGQEIKAREQAVAEATRELQSLGEQITRDAFVDLLVNAAGNLPKVEALGMMAGPLLDYTTFQMITDQANAADGEQREQIVEVRETLLAVSAALEQRQRAIVEQAAQTLTSIMQAPNVRTAIQQHANRIDNTFMAVLQANLEEATRTGNIPASGKLREIRDEVLALVQASAPPEVRLINDLLSIEDEAEALDALHQRQGELNPELPALMQDLAGQLREAGNEAAAVRLEVLGAEAARLAL